jgi:hypothetical protein
MARREIKKEVFLQAYLDTMGNTSMACKAANIGRRTFCSWREKDADFVKLLKEADEAFKDTAEGELKKKILNGDQWAIKYYLERHCGDRGYGPDKQVSEHDIKIEVVRKTIKPGDNKKEEVVPEVVPESEQYASNDPDDATVSDIQAAAGVIGDAAGHAGLPDGVLTGIAEEVAEALGDDNDLNIEDILGETGPNQ